MHCNPSVIRSQVAANLHRLGAVALGPAFRQAPYAVRPISLTNANAVVSRQIRRSLGRAMSREIGGSRAEYSAIRRNPARNDAGLRRRTKTDPHVERIFG